MTLLRGHGISVDLPDGWEGSIHWRDALPGETTHPVLHAASFPLPPPPASAAALAPMNRINFVRRTESVQLRVQTIRIRALLDGRRRVSLTERTSDAMD